MTTQSFFDSVSTTMQGSIIEILIVSFCILVFVLYSFYTLYLKQWLIDRKKTIQFYKFLKARHNLTDNEWKVLKASSSKAKINPFFLVFISNEAFEGINEFLRHELNNDTAVDELEYKIFNK